MIKTENHIFYLWIFFCSQTDRPTEHVFYILDAQKYVESSHKKTAILNNRENKFFYSKVPFKTLMTNGQNNYRIDAY